MRRVSRVFHTISWKNVRGLKCFDGVRSLKERGNLRLSTGLDETGFVIRHGSFNSASRWRKGKDRDIRGLRG